MSEVHHTPNAGAAPDPTRWRTRLRQAEDLLSGLAMAALVLLPLSEAMLKPLRQWGIVAGDCGIAGSEAFVQHLTLLIGVLGAALAAREGRLLSLAAAETFLSEKARRLTRLISNSIAAAICLWLAVSAVIFMLATNFLVQDAADAAPAGWSQRLAAYLMGFDCQNQRLEWNDNPTLIIAYGIPKLAFQVFLPFGFLLIGLRLLWTAAGSWPGRGAALLIAALGAALVAKPPFALDPPTMFLPAVLVLAIAGVMGLPIFAILGGAALLLFWSNPDCMPIASVEENHYALIINQTLPALPLFTLAGCCLAEGGASRRLLRLFLAWFGFLRGGPAVVTVLVCAFFTTFTGGSGVTILALAALLLPVLLNAGYKERSALGLLTASGSLGMLFPPCLPVILYVIVVNNQRIPGMAPLELKPVFLGGFLPGFLLVIVTAIYGILSASRDALAGRRFERREAWAALKEAKWDIITPLVALVGIFGGFVGMIEAAAITAFYAFAVETFLYRDLSLRRDLPRVLAECSLLIGGVLLIVGMAYAFTNYLVTVQVPDLAAEWALASLKSKYLFLLLLNLVLLAAGCIADIYSAIIILAPIVVPIGIQFGVDPVHLGIIFLANLELGFLTPPVGLNLFLASLRFRKPLLEICRAILPLLLVQGVGVLFITYVPALTTFLPRWLSRGG